MNVLVTGAAGFIGAFVARRLLTRGDRVTGIDNLNDYYDPELKARRLSDLLGVKGDLSKWGEPLHSDTFESFTFLRINLHDREAMETLMSEGSFDVVVNLAAQAGVRYSIDHPYTYVESNVVGFLNVLEGCRHNGVKHLVYASSSSVYGLNRNVPYSEHHSIAHPVSLYAATKKSNELMAHAYSQLYGIPVTGLRFFTVYGPWGRPDMSPFLFADAMLHDRPIKVFNNGDMYRDFTCIHDIVEGVMRIIDTPPAADPGWQPDTPDPASSSAPYRVYNIGNSSPVRLMDFIAAIEKAIGREAQKQFLPMQPGDVLGTYADTEALSAATGFKPSTPLQEGIDETVRWFKEYYNL